MTGFQQFIDTFGDITVSQIVWFLMGLGFIIFSGRKFAKYLTDRAIAKKEQDDKLKMALETVGNMSKYRKQSLDIQKELKDSIASLSNNQAELKDTQNKIINRLEEMEKNSEKLERNKLRETLLHSYRYYTNSHNNPNQCWTSMESEAFWSLFKEYEDRGGDGFVHTVIQPAMNKLTVIELEEKE